MDREAWPRMKDATVGTSVGAPAGANAGEPMVEVLAGGNVGTICVSGPCALCGRDVVMQNGQTRLVAPDRAGNRLGLVCFRCASAGEGGVRERLLSRARRLGREASRLERLVEGRIGIHRTAGEAAFVARSGPKAGPWQNP